MFLMLQSRHYQAVQNYKDVVHNMHILCLLFAYQNNRMNNIMPKIYGVIFKINKNFTVPSANLKFYIIKKDMVRGDCGVI